MDDGIIRKTITIKQRYSCGREESERKLVIKIKNILKVLKVVDIKATIIEKTDQ